MAKKIKITTKVQNILIGAIIFAFCLALGIKAFKQFSTNVTMITAQQLEKLANTSQEVEEALKRYLDTYFESMSEVYYDKRIKKSVLASRTRLAPIYQKKAHAALREFALFKNIKNIFLFDENFQEITSINRSIFLTEHTMEDITKRLENYKHRQVILQKIGKQKVALFLFKIDFSEDHHAYIVIIEDLTNFAENLSNYETNEMEFFLVTRTLEYKDSVIKLIGKKSVNYFNLQKETLLRFQKGSPKSFNTQGQETISRINKLRKFQHSAIVALLKPETLTKKVEDRKTELENYYSFKAILAFLLVMIYTVLAFSKINLQFAFIGTKNKAFARLRNDFNEIKPQDLSKEAKKQAYSYIEDENALKNSVFKVYNSLRKMSPEDIRNLSIKNSLSKENIRLVYQPVVDSKTMQVQFCEVFLRLLNYYGEELMPSEFIPVLKHFNMLENLDEMMLENVIRKIQMLQSTDNSARISLNISAGAFNSSKFLRKLKSGLITGNIKTQNVMLEIPNLKIIEKDEHSDFILDLAGYGIQFAVSINNLNSSTVKKIIEHKIKYLRVDMTEFSDVLENVEKQETLKQIIKNANKNNLQIIAERIETEFMFKLAKSLDINLLQGYHIGKPKKYYTHK